MKMDSKPLDTSAETPQDQALDPSDPPQDQASDPSDPPQDQASDPPQAATSRYYGVMDDEGADAVFVPPPPLPQVNNWGVTVTNGASDAKEAGDNPRGLDRSLSREPLMAAQYGGEEVSPTHISQESLDAASLSRDQDSTPPKDHEQTPMEDGSGSDPTGEHRQEIEILGDGREKCWHVDKPSSFEENETLFEQEDIEKDSKPTAEKEFESKRSPELLNQNNDATICQPTGNQGHQRSLDFNLTTLVRRESDASKTQVPRPSVSEGPEEAAAKEEEQEEGGRRIACDIQQGEQLLQRLQQLQLRQDEGPTEGPQGQTEGPWDQTEGPRDQKEGPQDQTEGPRGQTEGPWGQTEGPREQTDSKTKDETKDELRTEVDDSKARDEDEEKRSHNIEDEEPKECATKTPGESKMFAREETKDSESISWIPESTIDPEELSPVQTPLLTSSHRLSMAETCLEKQIHQVSQVKQNLQRAGGVFNLTDNPDVLEIPFKTNILLESFSSKDGPEQQQRSDWQFSEQKMKKEISQEIQRELVLVNLGKIPGGYSKGEVRQLKETKLLFEAFQQDNTEGPTRLRKPPFKGYVYPSVLERTRSLEQLSLKTFPVARASSLRLNRDAHKTPENFRPDSPRDKTRLSPYTIQDKHGRLCRSMDSISNEDPRSKTRQESPVLRANPFFKLRPALALQPEVEKDIREAKEREEELRRQRCTLYGEDVRGGDEGEKSRLNQSIAPDVRKPSTGKLERVWPPPSKKDPKPEQQEPKLQRSGGPKTPLWQRWESGLINGKPPNQTD